MTTINFDRKRRLFRNAEALSETCSKLLTELEKLGYGVNAEQALIAPMSADLRQWALSVEPYLSMRKAREVLADIDGEEEILEAEAL